MTAANGEGKAAYIRGVPHPLPSGESVLWEGAPSTRVVARHVFHWRWFAAYFAVMLLVWMTSSSTDVRSDAFVPSLAVRLGLTGLVLAIVFGLSRLVATTTWYAITNRRVVLRIGMVFPMSINIPFALLTSADVGTFADGTGQVMLTLNAGHRIAYIALWPHCRAFTFAQPRPMLRGLVAPAHVASILAQAVQAHAADTQEVVGREGTEVTRRAGDLDMSALGVPQVAGA